MEMLSSLISKPPSIKVIFEKDREKNIFKNSKGDLVEYCTYYDTDSVKGKIIIELSKSKSFDHSGLKVDLVGIIENHKDKKSSSRFMTLTKDLIPGGTLNNEITQFEFEFSNIEKQYETYKGKNTSVRYFLETTLHSKYKAIIHEAEFAIFKPKSVKELSNDNLPMKIEVGIEDWIHVSFEVDQSKYFLRDSIHGEVVFKKVSVRLESMELQLIKRETIGLGQNQAHDNEIVSKFEIMDGSPIKSKSIYN
jgi:vacuolar protein sorting-associated protein 26